MLDAMSGLDRRDWHQNPAAVLPLDIAKKDLSGLRIGCWSIPAEGECDTHVASIVNAAVLWLKGEGAQIASVRLPDMDLPMMFRTLWYSGIGSRVLALSDSDRCLVDPGLAEIVEQAKAMTAVDYVRAQSARADFGIQMDALFDDFDLIVSPAVSILPFACGNETPPGSGQERWIEWAGFNYPLNLSQQPACVIPLPVATGALPIGLQLFGARGADDHVLAVAATCERLLATEELVDAK